MAEFVWLDVVPDGDSGALRDSVPDDFLRGIPGTFPIGPPFRFRVHVRKDWLDQRTTDASDGSGKWVTAVIPMVLLNDWQTQSPGALPFFTAFGVTFQVDVTLAQSSPTWRGRVNVYVSGTGRLISLPASSDPDAAKYQLRLTAGTVRVFTRDGFWAMRSQGGEFLVDNHGGAILDRWRKEVWPDPRYDVAAVTFGSNNLQIDIVAERDPANRRRLELVRAAADRRVWQLCDCATSEGLRGPLAVLADHRTRLNGVLSLLPGQPIKIVDRGDLGDEPPTVLYQATRGGTPSADSVRELVRPNFDLTFAAADGPTRWSPQTLLADAAGVTLHDSPDVANLQDGLDPRDNLPDVVGLTWKGTASLGLSSVDLPPLRCVGGTPLRLAGQYLWQYAVVSPAPTPVGIEVPGWVRYELPDPTEPPPAARPTSGLSGPIAVTGDLAMSGWSLRIDVPERNARPGESTKRLELVVRDGTTRSVGLQAFAASVAAYSPSIEAYTRPLTQPSAPPNAPLFADPNSPALAPTRLAFEGRKSDPTPMPGLPRLIAELSPSGVVLRPTGDAVTAFLTFPRVATVDPLSASAPNLRQEPDGVTGRIVVERDASHGSTAWRIAAPFQLTAGGGRAPDKLTVPSAVFKPAEPRLDAAFALAPWVVCRDGLTSDVPATRRTLHHRNLVLEQGEFAAASKDRSSDGRPMAVAANRQDLIAATRDAYSIATIDLPNTAAAARPVAHWLPGAQLTGAAEPAAYLQPPSDPAGPLPGRAPIVRLAGNSQQLRLLPGSGRDETARERWLTYDVRWTGWVNGVDSRRPQIEIVAVADATVPTADALRRARNGSVPLLFDAQPLTAATTAAGRVVTGDRSGRLRVAAATTGVFARDLIANGAAIRAADAATITGELFVVALDANGNLKAWHGDTFTEVNTGLTPHAATVAALRIVGNLVFIATADGSGLRLWVWDTATPNGADNPHPINPPSGVVPAQVRGLGLSADTDGVILTVAQGSAAPVVAFGRRGGSGWTFTSVPFVPATAAGSAAVAAAELTGTAGPVAYAAAVAADGSACQVWRREGDEFHPCDSVRWDGHALDGVALVDHRASVGRHDPPGSSPVVALLSLSASAGEVAAWFLLPGASANPDRAPFRAYLGHRGRVLVAPAVVGQRTHWLTAGRDGIARLWDADAGFCATEATTDEWCYDTLGTVRPTTRGHAAGAGGHWQPFAFPSCPSAARSSADSAYDLAGNAVTLTLGADAAAPPLVADGRGAYATLIHFCCRDLVLTRAGSSWSPVSFSRACEPGEDRPRLAFPYHRGPVGSYRFFSPVTANGPPSLRGLPRLGGVPIAVVELVALTFAGTTDGGIDFSRITSAKFRAALLNPLDFDGSEPIVDEPDAVRRLPAVERAIATGAVVEVEVRPGSPPSIVIAAHPVFSWALPAVSEDPGGELPGRLARLALTAEWRKHDAGSRLTLLVAADQSKAELLGGTAPLEGVVAPLSGFGDPTTGAFGFELVGLPVQGSGGNAIALVNQAASEWPWDARCVAASGDIDQEAVAVGTSDGGLLWLDAASGLAWSRATLSATATSVTCAPIAVPAAFVADGAAVRAWDVRPDGRELSGGTVVPRFLHAASVTAIALPPGAWAARLATADATGMVAVWDSATGRKLAESQPFAVPASALSVAAVGRDADEVLWVAVAGPTAVAVYRLGRNGWRRRPDLPMAGATRLRLAVVGNAVHLAAAAGAQLGWWVAAPGGDLAAVSLAADGDSRPVGAVAIGQDGDAAAILYVRGDALRTAVAGTAPTLVGTVATNPLAAAFFAVGDHTHLVSVVAADARVATWTRMRGTGGWGAWTAADLTLPSGVVPAAADCFLAGNRPALLVGRAVTGRLSALVAFDLQSGVEIGHAVVAAGPSSDRLAVTAGPVPAPHAALGMDKRADVSVIDLRTGVERVRVTHSAAVKAVCLVRVGDATWVMASAGAELRAWDAAGGTPVGGGPYTAGRDIRHLTAAGGRALLVADDCRVWVPSATTPFPTGTPVIVPVTSDAVRAVVLATDATGPLVAFGFSDGVEVWDVSSTVGRRYRTASADAVDAVSTFAGPDGLHLAVGRGAAGIDVWTVPPANVAPLCRWHVAAAAGPFAPLGPADAPRIIAASAGRVREWPLYGVWRIDSTGAVRGHVRAELHRADVDDVGRFSATVRQAAAARATVWLGITGGPSRRLIARSAYRGVYGFVGEPSAPGTDAGRSAIGLWRTETGVLNGTLVREEAVNLPVRLAFGDLAHPTPHPAGANADLVRQTTVAFSLDGPSGWVRKSVVAAGRLTATHARWTRFALHLGEHDASLTEMVVHLDAEWPVRVNNTNWPVAVQGPVAVRIDWAATPPTVTMLRSVFGISPVDYDAAGASAPRDIVLPLRDGRAATFDVVGTRPASDPRLRAGTVRLHLDVNGLHLEAVRPEQIPIDPCLDATAVRSLGVQPEEVVALVHRQALGRRFRYRQLAGSRLDANPSEGPWQPATTGAATLTRWLLSPALMTGNDCRVFQQTLVVIDAGAGPATERTENLLLASRPGAPAASRPAVSLQSATGAEDDELLTPAVVAAALRGAVAPGVVVRRALRAGRPAEYRIVARDATEELPAAPPADPPQTTPAAAADHRVLPANLTSGERLAAAGHYLPTATPARPTLDVDRVAFRTVRVADSTRPPGPVRSAAAGRFGLFVTERTAFHRLPAAGRVSPTAGFAEPPEEEDDAAWFQPHALELRYSPDKPGAVMHHRIQGLARGDGDSEIALAPATDFAQRDPQQLDPPPGAGLRVERSTSASLPLRQATRLAVDWVETLGSYPLQLPPITALPTNPSSERVPPLVQLEPIPAPRVDALRVGFSDVPFVRCFLRVNEELIPLDADEARFPVMDARQAALTPRDLTLRDCLFEEPGAADNADNADNRPRLGQPVKTLDAASGAFGSVVLAGGDDGASTSKLAVWSVTPSQKLMLEMTSNKSPVLAALATRDGVPRVLCNRNGNDEGLFLLAMPWNTATSVPLTATPAVNDLVAVAAVTFDAPTTNGAGRSVVVRVECYAVLQETPPLFRVWYRYELDGTMVEKFSERDESGIAAGARLAAVAQPMAGGSEVRAAFAATVHDAAQTVAGWELDPFAAPASAIVRRRDIGAEGLTCFALAAGVAAPELYLGKADAVLRVTGDTGAVVRRYPQTSPTRFVATAVATTGPIFAVVTANESSGKSTTTLWHADSGRALRFAGRESNPLGAYNVAVPFAPGGRLRFAVAQIGKPEVQVIDPRLEAINPPEAFLVSRLEHLLDDLPMKVTIAGGSGPQSVDLVFTPQVILRDRLLPTQEYRTPLRDVFQAVDGMPTGMFVWDLKSDGLRLDRARTLRFAWRAEGNLDGQPFSVEADLFEPLPAKTIVPVPYSETSAKLAIVAFVDRRPPSGSPEPLLQRTAMFGDSASPERGKPAIHGRTNEETFAYESRDSARFDVPVPLVASGQVVVSPLVVKYLVNGQVLAAAPDGSG